MEEEILLGILDLFPKNVLRVGRSLLIQNMLIIPSVPGAMPPLKNTLWTHCLSPENILKVKFLPGIGQYVDIGSW